MEEIRDSLGALSLSGKTDLCLSKMALWRPIFIAIMSFMFMLDPSYAGDIGPDFILNDDNARPNKARITEQYLAGETTQIARHILRI